MAGFLLRFLPRVEEWSQQVLLNLGLEYLYADYMLNTYLRGWLLRSMFQFCISWTCTILESAWLSWASRSGLSWGNRWDPPYSRRLQIPVSTLWCMKSENAREQTVFSAHWKDGFHLKCQWDRLLEDGSWVYWAIDRSSPCLGLCICYLTSWLSVARLMRSLGVHCVEICFNWSKALLHCTYWILLSLLLIIMSGIVLQRLSRFC